MFHWDILIPFGTKKNVFTGAKVYLHYCIRFLSDPFSWGVSFTFLHFQVLSDNWQFHYLIVCWFCNFSRQNKILKIINGIATVYKGNRHRPEWQQSNNDRNIGLYLFKSYNQKLNEQDIKRTYCCRVLYRLSG